MGGKKETAALIGRAQGGGIITEEGNPYRTALFGDAAGAQPCAVAPGSNKGTSINPNSVAIRRCSRNFNAYISNICGALKFLSHKWFMASLK
ncbi:MAG: hypothetical protein NUV63_09385, partial [Gallionella sp.]|nr:hypothetical protein [Gallionella sp.]